MATEKNFYSIVLQIKSCYQTVLCEVTIDVRIVMDLTLVFFIRLLTARVLGCKQG